MKNLEDCLRELNRDFTVYKLWKLLNNSISLGQLYAINNDPELNVRVSTIGMIFDVTKELYGRGIAPWEYLHVQDWSKQEKKFK